ncbi:hypothetical protein GCM10009617_32700 [Leifsonia poae]|uniref:Uncharacterized protein n=1 Tax=Leifsonia poae TaxID=110933 RepID=A0A9W6LZW9_9MICO|nr:hypothetical protein GCM10017584_17160 [Leifsonia poae]
MLLDAWVRWGITSYRSGTGHRFGTNLADDEGVAHTMDHELQGSDSLHDAAEVLPAPRRTVSRSLESARDLRAAHYLSGRESQ